MQCEKVSIGNDVVDYSAAILPRHRRYMARVFTGQEQSKIQDDERRLWLYWAAKEAAFKAIRRNYPACIFSPIQFEFQENQLSVLSPHGAVSCHVDTNERYVHVVAVIGCTAEIFQRAFPKQPGHRVSVKLEPHMPQSQSVRKFAIQQIAETLAIEARRLSISKTERVDRQPKPSQAHVPILFIDDKPTSHLVSLSHDGSYLAMAFWPV